MMSGKPTYKELTERVKELEEITVECKQAEEKITHLNAVLNSIRCVNQLISKEKNRDHLIRGVCESLVKERGYYNAWIVLLDESRQVITGAGAGLGKKFSAIMKKLSRGDLTHCAAEVLIQSDLLAIKDPMNECADCPLSHKYHNRGAISAKLAHDRKVYGILTVSTPLNFSTDREEYDLFKDVADDIAFGLRNIEAETERREAEESLRKSYDELERRVKERTNELESLSSKLLSAQEEERKRIAGDLHDGIGQSLSAAKFVVETVLEQLNGATRYSQEIKPLESLVPMLQKASEEVRTIVMNLRPSVLDDLGIIATIGWFCRQFRTVYSAIDVEESVNIQEKDVCDPLKTTIFRVLQEAMNNVAKHSNASSVRLSLEEKDDTIRLIIQDNGQGFDIEHLLSLNASERGFGITSMKERTELSGGVFHIMTSQGKGTVIRAYWECDYNVR